VSLGYLAGNHINTIYHYITQYSYYVLIAALVLLAAYVTRRVMRRRSRPARKAASEPRGNAAHQKVPGTRKDAATHKPLAVQESSAVDGAQEAPGMSGSASTPRISSSSRARSALALSRSTSRWDSSCRAPEQERLGDQVIGTLAASTPGKVAVNVRGVPVKQDRASAVTRRARERPAQDLAHPA
jgi:hypothetical protein